MYEETVKECSIPMHIVNINIQWKYCAEFKIKFEFLNVLYWFDQQ